MPRREGLVVNRRRSWRLYSAEGLQARALRVILMLWVGAAFAQRMAAPQVAPQISAQTPAASWRRESDVDWAAAQERLSLTLNPSAIEQWIAPLRIRDVRGYTLRLNAPSSFHADNVTRNHGARIEAAMRAICAPMKFTHLPYER